MRQRGRFKFRTHRSEIKKNAGGYGLTVSICPIEIVTITGSGSKIADGSKRENEESKPKEIEIENGTNDGIKFGTKIRLKSVIGI
ncbi:hypothetical protein EVAR_92206_1 [Eumeta japonica]|uniref:Uncharacterized protein n=1 Tax=Eumeta variegata TaxID=151549 RepID=A0A4C1TNH0_EUMVA|nr:hypothetical protein EVAR_92206_1 [Eumeta japonica]